MKDIKAAVFDMDGLLIDSERICLAIFEQTCEQFGLEDKPALHRLYLSCVGTNAAENNRRIHAALQGRINVEEFLRSFELAYLEYTAQNTIPVKDGVESLLDALERRNIPAVIATSTRTRQAIEKLDKCGLTHRFKTITGGDQVKKSKPEPDIFLQAAHSIDANPTNCLAFEDSHNGVRAAVAAGMQVIQIPDLQQPDEALLSLGHTVLPSLAEVEATLWS